MAQIVSILISLIAVGWSFYSPRWAWTPLVAGALLLSLTWFGNRQKKWRYVEEISPGANEMLQKFGAYYSMPFAGSDFSAATSTLQFASVALGVIGAFKGFWWGLAGTAVFWFGLGPVAMAFNPTNFIRGTRLQPAHDEVIAWLTRRARNDGNDREI